MKKIIIEGKEYLIGIDLSSQKDFSVISPPSKK